MLHSPNMEVAMPSTVADGMLGPEAVHSNMTRSPRMHIIAKSIDEQAKGRECSYWPAASAPATPFFDVEDHDDANEDAERNDGSNGSHSAASEFDTPSPSTPATPGWRPRELRLLRSRASSNDLGRAESRAASSDGKERGRGLEGLAIRGVPLESLPAQQAPRDVMPIAAGNVSTTSQRSRSLAARSHSPMQKQAISLPRELKLSVPTASSSSSKWVRLQSPVIPAKTRLPVRHGPAFAVHSPQSAAGEEKSMSSTCESSYNNSSFILKDVDKDFAESSWSEQKSAGDESPLVDLLPTQRSPSFAASFGDSLQSSGSRKKGVPAALDLARSRKDARKLSKSGPSSVSPGRSKASPLTSPRVKAEQAAFRERMSEDEQPFYTPRLNDDLICAQQISAIGGQDAEVQSPETPKPKSPKEASSIRMEFGEEDFEQTQTSNTSRLADETEQTSLCIPTVHVEEGSVCPEQHADSSSNGSRVDSQADGCCKPFEYESSSNASHAPENHVVHGQEINPTSGRIHVTQSILGEAIDPDLTGIVEDAKDHLANCEQEAFAPRMKFNENSFATPTLNPRSGTTFIQPRDSSLSRHLRSQKQSKSSELLKDSQYGQTISEIQIRSAADLFSQHRSRQHPSSVSETDISPKSVVRAQRPENAEMTTAAQKLTEALQSTTAMSSCLNPASEADVSSSRDLNRASIHPVRTRNIAVPDVPTFGYMMHPDALHIANESLAPSSESSHPSSPYVSVEEEQQGVSHWSSGSEDEGDKLSASKSSSRKGGRKSGHNRRSSALNTANQLQQFRKGSAASLSTGSLMKKNALLNGLGLRKKSFPEMQLSAIEQGSILPPGAPGSVPNSESPVATKALDSGEYPFPKQSRPSFSFSRPSLSGRPSFSGPGLAAFRNAVNTLQMSSDNSSPSISATITHESSREHSPCTARSSLQSSMKSTKSPSREQLKSDQCGRRESGSSRTADFMARLRSASSINSNRDSESDKRESRCAPSDFGASREESWEKQSKLLKPSHSSDALRQRALTTGRIDGNRSPLSNRHQFMNNGFKEGPRKRSATMNISVTGFVKPQSPQVSSPCAHDRLVTSPENGKNDEIPEKQLPTTPGSYCFTEEMSSYSPMSLRNTSQFQRYETNVSSEALFTVGEKLVSRSSRRVRYINSPPRPRYPSLTDYGRQWQANNPDQAFKGALGPALLEWTLAKSSSEAAGQYSSKSVTRESDSGTDDYGTSESGSSQHENTAGGNVPGAGGDDPNSQDSALMGRASDRDEVDSSDSDSESSSAESADSYGALENDLPSVDFSRVECGDAPNDGTGSSSSDDAPLGQRLRELQMQAPRRTRSYRECPAKEVPSRQYTAQFDAQNLGSRLNSLQRAQTMSTRPSSSRRESAQPRSGSTSNTSNIAMQERRNQPSASKEKVAKDMLDKRVDTSPSLKELAQSGAFDRQSTTSDVVSTFAETVRARSRSRAGLRPAAIDVSRVAAVPALPRAYQAAPTGDTASTDSSHISVNEPDAAAGTTSPTSLNAKASNKHLLTAEPQVPTPKTSTDLSLHRVYFRSMQRYVTVSISGHARVCDLISMVLRKEAVNIEGRAGGWVLFDLCSSLKLERPLREYEAISDVVMSRTADIDSFILRQSDFAPYLSQQAVPSLTPAVAGWVYVQENAKKRSWSKRWLELRNNALYHSKSDKGRNAVQLCHLSSFDIYTPEAGEMFAFQAPKKNVFAMRSVDAVHLFENPEKDYRFYFSLTDDAAARHWITAILRARSFVLRQEKAHLFRAPTATRGAIQNNRSPTTAPAKPLLSFAPEHYERGSLLEQQVAQVGEGPSKPNASHPMRSAPLSDTNAMRMPPTSAQAGNARRHEEVMQAERRGRSDGKPLIGVVTDMSRYTRGGGGGPVEGSNTGVTSPATTRR